MRGICVARKMEVNSILTFNENRNYNKNTPAVPHDGCTMSVSQQATLCYTQLLLLLLLLLLMKRRQLPHSDVVKPQISADSFPEPSAVMVRGRKRRRRSCDSWIITENERKCIVWKAMSVCLSARSLCHDGHRRSQGVQLVHLHPPPSWSAKNSGILCSLLWEKIQNNRRTESTDVLRY